MFKELKLRQRYNNSIAFRYLSIAGIFLFTIQLIFSGIQSNRIYRHEVNHLEKHMTSRLKLLSIATPGAILNSDSLALSKILQENNKDIDVVYGVIINNNNEPIAQEFDPSHTLTKNLGEKFKNQQKYDLETELNTFLKENKSIVELRQPIQVEDSLLGEIWLGYSLNYTNKELLESYIYNTCTAIAISGLLIGLIIIIFNRQILKPIQNLKQLTQAIAAGELDDIVELEREDELGALSSAFNRMNIQLQHTVNNLEKAIDDALIAEKSKNKIMTKMSHELHTPLNSIIGVTQIMQQENTTTKEQLETLDIIEENSLHLLNLINDVLEMTQIEAGQASVNDNSFDFNNLLESLKQMFAFQAQEKHIKLSLNIDTNVPQYIESDEEKLRQILFNLLDNSIKFTDTGEVSLTVKYKSDDEKDFLHKLYFKITDTGRGISSEEIDNLFFAFTQTETEERFEQGMGLGLPLTRQLVQLMGGDISLESEVNQGTIVRFFIPVVEADISEISFQGYCATDS
ncbi:MAG: ATP-binding protein [Xenococcaceae cyanobacterium MO_234.B1]|nr:ATP-binding protein [Xenococcaceae cyanobacterium MO_234.B1]